MKKTMLALILMLVLGMSMIAGATSPQYHTVVAGDTLYALAHDYNTTVVELLDFNSGITPDKLEVGDKLLIPVETLWSYHVVQPGDNARSLAASYRVPLEELRLANGLSGNRLNEGETIRIPIHFYQGETAKTTHTVEIGDSLYTIAQRYNVTLGQLVEWNDIADIDNIMAGQTIIVG